MERAVAGHLPLDRQGQRKSAHNHNNKSVQDTTETWNWRVSFDNEFRHVMTKIVSDDIGDSRPVSKACHRVVSVIDWNFTICSSECQQSILAASRSARWALLHREREGGLYCESICADSVLCRTVSDYSGCDLNILFKTGPLCYSGMYYN